MSKILVFAEFQNNKLKRSSQELIQFAAQQGSPVTVLALGTQAAAGKASLAHNGASEVLFSGSADFDQYNPELFCAVVAEQIEKSDATIILASTTSLGKDLFPRVAAKLSAGLISDGTHLSLGGDLKVRKPMYSGKCFAEASFENCKHKIILMRANQLPIANADTGKTANETEISFTKPNLKTIIKQIVKGTSEKLDLTEANIIVSGGRGLKDAGQYNSLLGPLADALGATLGATRAIVDDGWVGHSMQVGQTGKTVAPSLYIAVGISGAIQHIAGMSGSKVIVAINSDPNAPIFQKATYGIVGDAFEIVPKLTEEFKKALHH